MEAEPSSVRIPTVPLAGQRLNLVRQILNLPPELQFQVLSHASQCQLLRLCYINTELFDMCMDPYLGTLKNWSTSEKLIFRIQLLNGCNMNECRGAEERLNQQLLNDPEFRFSYTNLLKYAKLYSQSEDMYTTMPTMTPDLKVGENITMDHPYQAIKKLRRINLSFTNFNHKIILAYFVKLEQVELDDSFNQPLNKDILPQSLQQLTLGS